MKRPNLHVLLNARVTKLIRDGSKSGNPSFRTVKFTYPASGSTITVKASKEVVLSAGSLNTPHLLLNSGIGDSNELKALGIEPLVHLSHVGKNLSVHISNGGVSYFVNSTDTYDDILRNATLRNDLLALWKKTHTGPLADGQGSFTGFFRLPPDTPIFKDHPDPASGPRSSHIQTGIQNGLLSNAPPTGHFIQIGATLVTPTSRGSLKLNPSNPSGPPLIDLGCLTTDFDIQALLVGFKEILPFFKAPAWDGYILDRFSPLPNITSDSDLLEFFRKTASPNGHIVGTASMSPKGANYGVVDPDLRVKGVSGLRIVDASILPLVPAGNTQAPTYFVAERASDLIKEAWK